MKCHECTNCAKIIKNGKEVFICFRNWVEKEVDPSNECEKVTNAQTDSNGR